MAVSEQKSSNLGPVKHKDTPMLPLGTQYFMVMNKYQQ